MQTKHTETREKALSVVLSAIVIISVVAVGSAAFAGSAAAQTVDLQVGDSSDAGYSTIQGAVDNAQQGAVIGVEEGSYDQVIINRNEDASNLEIVALGDRSATTISHSASDGTPTVAVDQDGITLEGFTIERTGSTNVAQAVRVAGDDITLTDNVYSVNSEDDAAIGVLTESSGAAGNPTFDGEISSVDISGGEVSTDGSSGASGILVADNGPATFAEGAVTISDVDFAAGGNNNHLLGLDTGGNVVATTTVFESNTFDTAAAPTAPDQTLNGFSVDSLIANNIQDAVSAATAGDTVSVAPGTYEEDVKLGADQLTLEGAGASETTIVGQNNRPGAVFISSDHPGITVSGFTVEAGSSSTAVQLSSGTEITDVTFSQNTFVGADGQVNVFVGGDHEDIDFQDNTFSTAAGADPIEHLFIGGEASYGSGAESATSSATEDDIVDNTFEGGISRTGDGNAIEFEAQHGEIADNNFTAVTTDGAVVAVPGTVGDGNSANIQDINGETSRIAQIRSIIDSNDGVTTTDPPTVSEVNLANPTGRTLEVNVTTTGPVDSSLGVELDGETAETGTDVTLGEGELTGSENGDGTYTYTATATADVASGSSASYQASVTELEGRTDTDALPVSQQRSVTVQTFEGGSATVDTGSTKVPSATVSLDTETDTEVVVSSSDDVPTSGDQSKEALASDVDVVDEEDSILSALNINVESAVEDTSATLEFTVRKENVGSDPTNLLVTRYSDGSYQSLKTTVVESEGETITLEAKTPGFSPFVIVETDESPAETGTDETSGGGSGGGSNVQGALALNENSVSERISMDPVQEVTVEFDQPTTGSVQIEAVDGFPAGAPTPAGQVLSTIEIAPPSDVANAPGSVEVSISRSTVSDADAEPSALQLVRYNEQSGELEALDTEVVSEDEETVVISAETPGFSVFGVIVSDQEATTATPTATATPEPTATETPEPTATAEPTPTDTAEPATDTPTPTSGGGPGFGAIVAVIALIAAALLAARRDN